MTTTSLVLGGARSGKSALAERLVLAHPGELVYLATGRAEGDADMAARIERHRLARDPRFTTIEADGTAGSGGSGGSGGDLAHVLATAPARPMLVDALGTWVAAQPEFAGATPMDGRDWTAWWDRTVDDLGRALTARAAAGSPTVLVSDEVGLGVHPESAAGRRFRDVLGQVNQQVAEVADEVVLVVAGRVLRLDRADALFGSYGSGGST
jgi:adenosylcobinamide kinase/adenosylcobinamide-phosphate guanylyltransferase